MEKIKQYWQDYFHNENKSNQWWTKKQVLWKKRQAEIMKVQIYGRKYRVTKYDDYKREAYLLHVRFLIKQKGHYHFEEQILSREVLSKQGEIIEHIEKQPCTELSKTLPEMTNRQRFQTDDRQPVYNRREAVRYAERWWNDYNPQFRQFTNDCTNFISQCLLAGGAPMRGMPIREQGWWYHGENWSFSWSVAHSFRWYLSGSTSGLQATEVQTPEELALGDVICYDFLGDGRWDHTTIVVRYDAYGMPLVNAHTDNSRNRYWSYEDSTAWTPDIQYKFFRIRLNML